MRNILPTDRDVSLRIRNRRHSATAVHYGAVLLVSLGRPLVFNTRGSWLHAARRRSARSTGVITAGPDAVKATPLSLQPPDPAAFGHYKLVGFRQDPGLTG